MSGRDDASLIAYPCEFPLKIMGHTRAGFAQAVLAIVQRRTTNT